ncbi:MAG: DUF1778 domain-containing protein [Sumerlaeia bacterium]
MDTNATKTSRIEARVNPIMKERLIKAAAIQGCTLSDFVVDAVREKADHVIESHEIITLTEQDRELFFEALRNPPEANDALKEAFRQHREYFGEPR